MGRTPGLVVPSAYSSTEELEADVRRRDAAAGFTPFAPTDFVDDALEHYGVKGMKWGQVRSRSQIDAGDSFDVVAVKEAKQKISAGRSTDALSNKELQTVVTRMNLEQQYSRLVKEGTQMNPLVKKQLDAGKAAVISLGVKHAEDKITDFIANKNPAAGIVLKTLLEAKRKHEQQGKKNK